MPNIITKGQKQFPELASFMGGWFHQDFDIHGDTPEAVTRAFILDTDRNGIAALIRDIDGFLATGDQGLGERFEEYFMPDIIPTAFCPTTRAFLEAIRDELRSAS